MIIIKTILNMKMMKKKRRKIPPSAGKKIPNNKYLSSINTYLKLPPPNLPTIIIQKKVPYSVTF